MIQQTTKECFRIASEFSGPKARVLIVRTHFYIGGGPIQTRSASGILTGGKDAGTVLRNRITPGPFHFPTAGTVTSLHHTIDSG